MNNTVTQGGVGAQPAVRVRYGSKPGASFRVKFLVLNHRAMQDHVIDADVPNFQRAALAFSGGGKNRCFILEPLDKSDRFEFEGFFVEGRFKIVERVGDPKKAAMVFKAFKPE